MNPISSNPAQPVTAVRAAEMIKVRLARLRGPARLHPSIVHREIYALHQDALHLCELLAGSGAD